MLENILKFWVMKCTKHCNARKNLKSLKFCKLCRLEGHRSQTFRILGNLRALECLAYLRATKHCNARKIMKILSFCKLCRLEGCRSRNFKDVQDFSSITMFGTPHAQKLEFFFRALQCLVYLRATKHCSARKILKFWGMRCTNHSSARKILKTLRCRDL